MKTNVERLLALGFERIGEEHWKRADGCRVYLSREHVYRTHMMNHRPSSGQEVPQYGEPKILVTSWTLTEKGITIQQHSTLRGLLKWLEARQKETK
jgi:hypothetical protein